MTNALTYTDTATANWPVRFYRTPTNHLITPFSVKMSGPYPVGVLSRKLTDPSRPSRYRAYDDGSFMVSVWYPAAPLAGLLPGSLLDPQIAQDPFFMQQWQIAGFPGGNWIDRAPQLLEYGLPHAPIATNLPPCPILLCSPMGGGWRASLAEKAANLASHGFLVVVSDPCDAGGTVFPDGTYLKLTAASWPPRSDYLEDRVRDLAFILDELTRWNACDPTFAGRLDLTKVAALGTCSGFCCAAEFCRRDPRCRAAVLVACSQDKMTQGGMTTVPVFPLLDQLGVGKPILVIGADYPPPIQYDFLFNKAANDAITFQIQGTASGGHGAYIFCTDYYLLLEPYRQPTGKEAARTIADYSVWFLNRYLKGSSDPAPASTNYPRIYGLKQK